MLRTILDRFQSVVQRGLRTIRNTFSRWTKPISSPTLGTITDLIRTKPQLIAENLLRQ